MLKLYNAGASVCSVKARIGLAEKGLDWEDVMLSLPNGDQHKPDYLKLNPNGVVPTLIDGDTVVIESGVILQYIDDLGDGPPMMPTDKGLKAEALIWLLRGVEMHAAINTMSFATANRDAILASKTPDEIDAMIARMPNPSMAAKRRDLLDKGVASDHLGGAFFSLRQVFADMKAALASRAWMNGEEFGMIDVAILAYIDRLDRLSMRDLWADVPRISEWLDAARARPGYARAMDGYVTLAELEKTAKNGGRFWPQISEKWDAFLAA